MRLHEGARAPDAASLSAEYDLVVAADGAGSTIRTALAERFGTTVERTAPDYVWLGADRSFDSLTFLVSDTPRGPVVAHVYPYEPGRSTFLVEAAFKPTVDELSELFADRLPGARLLENQSRWSRFTQVSNAAWSHGNVVLVGDAAHTAHYSVGSGTRLALDDARALAAALRAEPSLPGALAAYETGRRPAVEHTQRIGRESADWFAGLADAGPSSPEEFLVDLVTRGGQISMGDITADADGGAPAGTVVSGR
ncbi:FAD-dependent monooxygenase [Streptomyces diastaticus]|uniref:FAD-dependent monooxygenase n=2 Tax=Streptomyces diastaticus TaxID=1956 RepID=UPI00364F57DC